MERLGRALIALALVAPALSAPGPVPTRFWHQHTSKAPKPWEGAYNTTIALAISHPAPPLLPPSPATATTLSPPTELRKRKGDNRNGCTPGDRACYHTLDEVVFCNEDHDWVPYATCEDGTFCHRLHVICVPEILTSALTSAAPTLALGHRDDDDRKECKEGDRRCDRNFNRVDRCNAGHEWVTYHDCRKSELCNEDVLECLPKLSVMLGAMGMPKDTGTRNSTPTNSV
ncbi:hypothetical protein F4824DRAFT_470093 [Ustulina deusta]|nr:hypothetical protein F4824DRAFT_470093 [Ustulina deusta]